jgi:hypothetical protein
MLQREFESHKALIEYAEQNGLVYLWRGYACLHQPATGALACGR